MNQNNANPELIMIRECDNISIHNKFKDRPISTSEATTEIFRISKINMPRPKRLSRK